MNNEGYSTIELLIYILLLGCLIMLIVFRYNIYRKNIQLYEYKTFVHDINFAKNSSRIDRTIYYIQIDMINNKYIIKSNFNDNTKIIKDKIFKSGISFKSNNFNGEIIFSNGKVMGKGGNIILDVNRYEKTITITPVVTNINEKNK